MRACATDDFTKFVYALVYHFGPESERSPTRTGSCGIIEGCGMMCSVLALTLGNYQDIGHVGYSKICQSTPPWSPCSSSMAPSYNTRDMRRTLDRGTSGAGFVGSTIIKPKLGLQPKPFGEACEVSRAQFGRPDRTGRRPARVVRHEADQTSLCSLRAPRSRSCSSPFGPLGGRE